MTILVGIRCRDGVVLGADSSVTFGPGPHARTIEQSTDKKIEIIGEQVIVAGTGYVGHQQRFADVVTGLYKKNDLFGRRSALDIARAMSTHGTNDFASTNAARGAYAALVAYKSSDSNFNLCEFGSDGFQPEMKEQNGLWWVAAGSGQAIVDPFLALLGQVFWKDGPPSLRGGIFTAYWALKHACELNPGGIQEPIHIATLCIDKNDKGRVKARKLDADSLAEHGDMILSATERLRSFRDVLEGSVEATEVPKPQNGNKVILPGLPIGHS